MWDLIVSVPDHCLSFYFAFVKMVCRYELHGWNRLNWVCKCKREMHV